MRYFAALLVVVASIASLSFAATKSDDLRRRVTEIQSRLPQFKQQLGQLRARGDDVSYPLVTYTVLENFTGYAMEDLDIAVPNGWGFLAVNGANVTYEPTRDAHGGHWAARLSSRQPQTPNVYGKLENVAGANLVVGTKYTLSVWAKCREAGITSLTLNGSWTERMPIGPTGDRWKQFTRTFTATETGFGARVLVEGITAGVIVDDLCLVEGATAEEGKNLIANGDFETSWSAQRVARELPDMEKMTVRLKQQLADAAAGKIQLAKVSRWSGGARPHIEGPSFVGADGRPIFFIGYGHFQQVRDDIEKFPAYGINIVQHGEFGPREVFPAEDKIDDAPINRLVDELDRAAKAGVAVDFLISPHYMPDWLFAKYPHLRKARADFFPYSIYASEGRALVKRFIDYVIPKIKDKPALLSVCLSNEPINAQEPDQFSRKAWCHWLALHHHGDISKLNDSWHTHYASFADVPQPSALNRSDPEWPSPIWADFCRWNDEYFSDFHKSMADMVHGVAPNLPVHAKATTWHMYRADLVANGDEPTRLDAATDINGNDSVNLWSFNERGGDLIERGTTDFAQGWRENALAYELQRSTHEAPVFNSENHLIFDRETRYVDPAHVRSALWMGAIHGQSATTLWVWQREKSNPGGDFAGDIMERASCAEAVGIVNLDLNRAAEEITVIQKSPARAMILVSPTAALWDGKKYENALVRTFTGLSFTGVKVGFVTERQLEQGFVPKSPVLFLPATQHVSRAAAEALLQKYKGTLIPVDERSMLTDEYDAPLPAHPVDKHCVYTQGASVVVEPFQRVLDDARIVPVVRVLDSNDRPQSGVQWQTAAMSDHSVVMNLYNASHDPQTVLFRRTGVTANAMKDFFTGQTVTAGQTITLAPMEVRLFRE